MRNYVKTLMMIALVSVVLFTMSSCDLFPSFDPPTGLIATLLPNGNIHITWNAVDDAINYTIAYRTNLDSADTRRNAGTSRITTFTHSYYSYSSSGITTNYYYVKAHNLLYTWEEGYKETGWSSPVSVNIR